jgi:hypothetical protein
LGILFPSFLCTCRNQRNPCSLIVSIIVGSLTVAHDRIKQRIQFPLFKVGCFGWFHLWPSYTAIDYSSYCCQPWSYDLYNWVREFKKATNVT